MPTTKETGQKEQSVFGKGIPILTDQFIKEYEQLIGYISIKDFNRNTRRLWLYYLMKHKNWFSFHYDKYFEDLLYFAEFLDVMEDLYGDVDNTRSHIIIDDTFKKALMTFLQLVPLTRLARALRGLLFDHIIHEENLEYKIQEYFQDLWFVFEFINGLEDIYDQKEFLKYRDDRLDDRDNERPDAAMENK